MNTQQRCHIINRINQFKWDAKQALESEYSTRYDKSIKEERKNKVLQIMNGTAKIKKKIPFDATILEQVFNFKNLSKGDGRTERGKNCRMLRMKEDKMNKVCDMAEKAADEIILTDGENAIKLLKDFEVYCKTIKLSK